MVPATFSEAVAKRLRAIENSSPSAETPDVSAAEGDFEMHLALDVSGKSIRAAWFSAPDNAPEAAVLDLLCDYAAGATVRELVEHGLIYVLQELRDPSVPAPVSGILTPRNAGPCFAGPLRLLATLRRAAEAEFGKPDGTNFFDRPYSTHWKSLDKEGKRALVAPHIDAFRAARGISPEAFELVEIDQYDRLFLVFSDEIPAWDKPGLLMEMEHWLRDKTGERIELFTEVVKDENRIRRL